MFEGIGGDSEWGERRAGEGGGGWGEGRSYKKNKTKIFDLRVVGPSWEFYVIKGGGFGGCTAEVAQNSQYL